MKTTDFTLGAFEGKNKFSDILNRVSRGAEVTITKHDRPAARVVPVFSQTQDRRKKATAELRALRKRCSLKGLSVRSLIDKGRR